jgi:hypothetical protein
MTIAFLGPSLQDLAAAGWRGVRVATLFLRQRVLVTEGPIHALQRAAFLDHLNRVRDMQGRLPLRPDEAERELEESVDLFLEASQILIRPDPQNMHLAFEADDLLQTLVSKRQIKFMHALNPVVRHAVKQRGECWRISPLPRSREEMRRLIQESKAAIAEQPIYYYSRASGTRYLTFHEFAALERLAPADLARQLQEVAVHAVARNRLNNPEVDFFAADPLRFNARDFAGYRFAELAPHDLLAGYRELRERFREAVPPDLRTDDLRLQAWRNLMVSALVNQGSETVSEEILRGLSPEFFLSIEWLPGGRFEEGEFVLDSIYDEAADAPHDEALQRLCEPKTRGFIFNFIREYGDLEYVNVGRVAHSLNAKRPLTDGRREVYIAELKPSGADPVVRFIRLLKWGIREHLDAGRDLLQAMLKNEEYVDYVLDRRLGCRQLGMNLPARITIHRVPEVYHSGKAELNGQIVHAPYSERDYIPGIATDKLPTRKYAQPGYAERLARLLGKAAASNIIVGRTYDAGGTVVFDDGDEVVLEGDDGLPRELLVGDHSGAFGEYTRPLVEFAKEYARVVNDRAPYLPDPRTFAEIYLAAFREWFLHIQGDYRKRRRAFDNLFNHCRYDPGGSFAFRWEGVLRRLDQTNVDELVEAIRKRITVLGAKREA